MKTYDELLAERDALAREVDESNEKIGELTGERDQWYGRSFAMRRSLGRAIQALQQYEVDVDTLPTKEHQQMMDALNRGLDPSPDNCMRAIKAAAGRAGFVAGYEKCWRESYGTKPNTDSVDEYADSYADKMRQGVSDGL